MDKTYNHKEFEGKIYKVWEESGAFKPSGSGKPFTIIMPPPNANGELHLGHATFVAVSDVLVRYHRMRGDATLWLPGVDHAGILSQVTFEKKLRKEEDKGRYDLGRKEFYRRCYEFCMQNKSLMENQMKALGASCDWSREKFTLDPEVSELVFETFIKMYDEGLIYRGYRIVNWCPRCRSTLADVELEREECEDKLYFVRYPLANSKDYITVATTRVEPIWLDTHLAVNPQDKKNKHLIGKKAKNPLTGADMEIIGDDFVDPEFGTGIVKLTPAHDAADYEAAIKHNLPIKNGVDFDGRLIKEAGEWAGMKTAEAREKIALFLSEKELIEKIDEHYKHEVSVCERCGTIIEPLVSRQWFVKIKALAQPAIKAVENGEIKIVPKKYEKMYFNWMKSIKDWPISRQLWWGHQLPVWYRKTDQKTVEQKAEYALLEKGDTRARTDILESPVVSLSKPSGECIQDPDTFDTWFSSGQWPVNTLKTSQKEDFNKFYPTTIMNTAYEILFLWVARMIMFGLYLTGKPPFEIALINGVLRDETGAKMSKSKGNGVNPNEAIEKYGTDAVRMALIAGRENGNDLLISKQQMEQRIRGYGNFSNKVWNAARFVKDFDLDLKENKIFRSKLKDISKETVKLLNQLKLGQASELLYNRFWHWYCDEMIEGAKKGEVGKVDMEWGLQQFLILLHPFMPFVTEAIWQELGNKKLLITQSFPKV